VTRQRHRAQASELPIQSDRAQARGAGKRIEGDIVRLKCAGVDIAQHEVADADR
jgi:hypothetical protein